MVSYQDFGSLQRGVDAAHAEIQQHEEMVSLTIRHLMNLDTELIALREKRTNLLKQMQALSN